MTGQTTVTDRENNSVVYHFDDLTRITKVVDAMGEDNNSVYDADYNVVEFTDRNGNTWFYDHDDRGNVVSETDPLGNGTAYTYNAENDLTSVIDALGSHYPFRVRGWQPDPHRAAGRHNHRGHLRRLWPDGNPDRCQRPHDAARVRRRKATWSVKSTP